MIPARPPSSKKRKVEEDDEESAGSMVDFVEEDGEYDDEEDSEYEDGEDDDDDEDGDDDDGHDKDDSDESEDEEGTRISRDVTSANIVEGPRKRTQTVFLIRELLSKRRNQQLFLDDVPGDELDAALLDENVDDDSEYGSSSEESGCSD